MSEFEFTLTILVPNKDTLSLQTQALTPQKPASLQIMAENPPAQSTTAAQQRPTSKSPKSQGSPAAQSPPAGSPPIVGNAVEVDVRLYIGQRARHPCCGDTGRIFLLI